MRPPSPAPTALTRRQLLAAAVLGSAAACSARRVRSVPAPSVAPTSTVATPPPPAAVGRELDRLAGTLDGALVRPTDPRWDLARRLYDPKFDGLQPLAVAQCRSVEDVRRCLAFAATTGVRPAPRSGGHSYGGWSSGDGVLVVDVGPLAAVTFPTGGGTGVATVGAGARLVDVYAALGARGVTVPAGSCPSVGIAGQTLGGGNGVTARAHGLTCDRLRSVELVLADGRVVTADADHEPDLFWASRGGGGGSFGVATAFTLATTPTVQTARFRLRWAWSDAAAVLPAWLAYAPAAPEALWSDCQLLATPDRPAGGEPTVAVNGLFLGTPDALRPLLARLVAMVGRAPRTTAVTSTSYLETMLVEAGCSGRTVAQCHLAPDGTLPRTSFAAASDYVTQPLPGPGVQVVVDQVARRQADPRLAEGGVAFDSYGGAIAAVPSDATAFVHRDAPAGAQYTASWPNGAAAEVVAANQEWLAGFHTAMRPYVSGGAYVNYADPSLLDWEQAYFGAHVGRLRQVKRRYDPDGLFAFPQGITAA